MRIAAITASNRAAALARFACGAAKPAAMAASFQSLMDDGTLLTDDFFAAHSDDDPQSIHGVIFAQRLGGAQAAVWPPVADDEEIADRLAETLVNHLKANGHRVFQTVVRIPNPPGMASLARLAFVAVSDLIFMSRDIEPSDGTLPATRLKLRPAAKDDLVFAELIEATYIDSLDMAELNETRSAAELLASCQATAKVDPPFWWFAMNEGKPVGVLQLAPADAEGEYELTYMGLIPAARRQGFGAELARRAIVITASLGGTRLLLSHDARNDSARRVYDQLGFHETNRREVWLKISRDSTPVS